MSAVGARRILGKGKKRITKAKLRGLTILGMEELLLLLPLSRIGGLGGVWAPYSSQLPACFLHELVFDENILTFLALAGSHLAST